MANTTNKKFGVVHGAPSQLANATIEEGKLYFLAGEADGAIKQGIYGVDGITADASGNVTDYDLAMFGCGSVADGTGYGLSQYSFDSDASTKLKNLHDASSNYLLKTSYVQVSKSSDGYVPKADGVAGTINSHDVNWVLTYNGTSVDWHKLPADAFKNDNSIYSGTSPIDVSGTDISHAYSGVTVGRYGDTSSARALEFGGKFKVVDVSVNEFGHVTDASSYELTLPSKPATAGTADEAKKTTGTLTFNVNGEVASKFNGSVDTSLNFKNGTNIKVTEESDGVIKIDTSGVPTTIEMNNAITTALTSALKYKGTVKDGSVLPTSSNETGDVYVACGAYTTSQNSISYKCETGDLFIFNGSYFDIVNGENQVENKNAAISANGTEHDVSIATVDGTDITVKVPAAYYTHPVAGNPTQSLGNTAKNTTVAIDTETKIATVYDVSFDASGHYKGKVARDISIKITSNNTDEKVKANTSTGKFYLIGQDDATSGTTETAYKNASVYVDGGYLYSGGAKVLTSYTEQYKGTVTSITPGTGLINGTTVDAITSTGTLNLKIASSSEIGGVKPGTTHGKTYGVKVNASTGEMTVNVPWTDNNDNNWRDVYVGEIQRLGTGVTSGSLKFVNGTNITATWNSANNTIQFDATGLATNDEVATAKSEAITEATIYWETL